MIYSNNKKYLLIFYNWSLNTCTGKAIRISSYSSVSFTFFGIIVKEMCGTVSFKRGEAYCRSNKVSFARVDDDVCEATVTGSEDFYVTIKKAERGGIEAHCSCPKLASFQKDCQHIAAVLLALYEKQKNNRSSQNCDSKISINQ